MTKEQIKEKEQQLLELTGTFCAQKLNQEYVELCEKLIKKMGRKREVPFKRGKPEIWAAAVVNAIGSINFLGDKSFEPYLHTRDPQLFWHQGLYSVCQSQNDKGYVRPMVLQPGILYRSYAAE